MVDGTARGEAEAGRASGHGLWSTPLFVGALLWLGGTILAPYAAERGWAATPLFYLLYEPVCHQMPARSFSWWQHSSGACHRCVGLYAGFVLGLLFWPGWRGCNPLRDWVLTRPRRVAWFAVPLLVDVSLYSRNIAPTRFVTGVVAALPLALLAEVALRQLRESRSVATAERHAK